MTQRYKASVRWRIRGRLTTLAPLHIGSGDTTEHDDLVDKETKKKNEIAAVARDHDGRPIIPGSALKGVLRSWAALDDPDHPAINRVFGNFDSSRAGLGEFFPTAAVRPTTTQLAAFESLPYWRADHLTGVLSHVSIDRKWGVAADKKLFFEEFVPEGVTFEVTIEADRLDESDIRFLLTTLRHGTEHPADPLQLGSNAADGWGRVEWAVECKSDAVQPMTPPLVLPILAQPKPAQGRFYLMKTSGQVASSTKEQAGYTEDNRIRGPKAHPHHAKFDLDALRRLNTVASDQNRTVTGVVKRDTEFEFELRVLNLSRTELAALVWLLTLPEEHFFRLGLGKPLGFGSVRLSIADSRVADGADWAAKLDEWEPAPNALPLLPLRAEFEAVMNPVNPTLLPSFLQLAKGFGDVKVSYPPNPKGGTGMHYEWFVANEGRKAPRSLPDPLDPMPLLPVDPQTS